MRIYFSWITCLLISIIQKLFVFVDDRLRCLLKMTSYSGMKHYFNVTSDSKKKCYNSQYCITTVDCLSFFESVVIFFVTKPHFKINSLRDVFIPEKDRCQKQLLIVPHSIRSYLSLSALTKTKTKKVQTNLCSTKFFATTWMFKSVPFTNN